jgi:hypothetical protein
MSWILYLSMVFNPPDPMTGLDMWAELELTRPD